MNWSLPELAEKIEAADRAVESKARDLHKAAEAHTKAVRDRLRLSGTVGRVLSPTLASLTRAIGLTDLVLRFATEQHPRAWKVSDLIAVAREELGSSATQPRVAAQVARLVDEGRLVKVSRGVYRLAGGTPDAA